MVEPMLVIGGVTLMFTLYIAYKSKASSVESERERQRYLTERCSGQKAMGEPTVIRIETVDFEGKKRGIRGWLSEEYPGDTIVTMTFMNVFVYPSFLEGFNSHTGDFSGLGAEELETKVVAVPFRFDKTTGRTANPAMAIYQIT